MSRIAETFARVKADGRIAVMPYLMSGFPDRETALELGPALQAAGADLFELGVPFSDPLADGATVQRAAEVSLANGIRLPDCIETASELRRRGVTVPIVLMGYYNPFLQYGIERLCVDAARAGIDGLIIPDLPPAEAADVQTAAGSAGLDLILFVAPTTPDARVAEIGAIASGFIYCVSLTGVTGARAALWEGLPDFLSRVRAQIALPLVVGFGISTAAHVRALVHIADGAISASALIGVLEQSPPEERVARATQFVAELREAAHV